MKRQNNLVGKTKNSLRAILILLLAAGWILTLYSVTVDRELRDQTALIRSADAFLEDKLYIRAARIYMEAINDYQTAQNEEIEERLLKTYKAGEMWDDYYDLIQERIEKEKAGADEYLILAQFYLESGNAGRAVEYLELGRSVFPENEEMITLSESVRYETSGSATIYQQVGTFSESCVQAFDGEKWGYILENGNTALDFQYEEATEFSGGYAVVKLDGVYTLIDQNGYWNAVDKNGLDQVTSVCGTRIVGIKDGEAGIYTNTFQKVSEESYEDICLNSNGLIFAQRAGKWALLDEDLEPVTDFVFTDVARNSRGEAFYRNYAVVSDETGYYLIDPKGEAWFDARFSDAKGIESGLVAVADSSGKWGFCDEKGELVVDCQYEDAKSFSSCLGAVKYAGKWGYINQYHTMVIENEYEDAAPFAGETGLVTDGQGYCRILKLKYYDVYMGQ